MPLDGLGRMARGAALVLVLMTLLLLLLLLLMLVIGNLLFNTTRARARCRVAYVQHNAHGPKAREPGTVLINTMRISSIVREMPRR